MRGQAMINWLDWNGDRTYLCGHFDRFEARIRVRRGAVVLTAWVYCSSDDSVNHYSDHTSIESAKAWCEQQIAHMIAEEICQ
jgi:hypothetical protein